MATAKKELDPVIPVPDEIDAKDARIAELEAALAEAQLPRDGTSIRDVRILGSVQIMGESAWIPVAVIPARDTEKKAFVDRCDDLALAPRMQVLEPGVEPPALHEWPNMPDVDPSIPRGPSRPLPEEAGAW